MDAERRPPASGLRPRAQRLLAFLLLNRQTALSREHIAFSLWPDELEEHALGILRRALSDMRATLPRLDSGDWIAATRNDIHWDARAPFVLDVAEFDKRIQAGSPTALYGAIQLYTADLLEDWDDEWIQPERLRLRQMQFLALLKLAAHHRALAEYDAALGLVRRALALDPLSESAERELITLLYLGGDRAAALAEYDRFLALLDHELGVEPMSETRALAKAITQGAPLAAPAAPAPGRQPPQAPAGPRLIGRDHETKTLSEGWDSAASGRGRLIVVAGEAGIGKTSLLRSAAARANGSGGLALVGHCYEFEHALPFQAVTEMLRAVSDLLRHSSLAPAHRSQLAQLAPDVLGAAGEPPAEPRAMDLRTQLFEALWQAFLAVAHSQPLALLFEDVHWAAESTLDWLTYIVPRLSTSRVLVVTTCRTDEVGAEHTLARLERRFAREGTVLAVRLPPLSREANREMVGDLSGLGAGPAAFAADRLFAETAGNPFFLHEVVRGLIESGQIQVERGRWTGDFLAADSAARVPLPDSLRATISTRVERLTEMSRMFIRVAAVAGRVFQYEDVRDAGDWRDEPALAALEDVLARGFVQSDPGDSRSSFAFSHHLVREAIYADLTAPRRAYLHRRLAEAIRARRPNDFEALAHHFAQAGDQAHAVAYFHQTAQRALAMHAYVDALGAFESAGHAMGHLKQDLVSDSPERERQEIELLLGRAALIPAVGRPLDVYNEVMEALGRLLARHPDRRFNARYALLRAEWLSDQGQYERAFDSSLKAHEDYAALGDRRGAAQGMYFAGRYKIMMSQNRLGRQYMEQALALYHEAGDLAGESWCANGLAWSRMHLGEVASALAVLARALDISERQADKLGMARASLTLSVAWSYYYALDQVQACATRALRLFREVGYAFMAYQALLYLAEVQRRRGELEQAERSFQQVLSEALAGGDRWLEGWTVQMLGRLALARGDLPQAEQFLQRACQLRQANGELANHISDLAWLGRLRLSQANPAGALAHTAEAMRRLDALMGEHYVWEMQDVYFAHAESLSANGEPGQAQVYIGRAHETLIQFAAQIEDPATLQAFMDYPTNARIVQAWKNSRV
jgi:DNA-binding SARP family transcriptional activator